MNDLKKTDLQKQLGNIDQIRDILFGSQIREYNNRLDQVEKSLSGMQQEIRDRTDEVKQVLSTEIQAVVETIEKKLKSLTIKDEDEKTDIRQQLELLSRRISSNSEEIKKTLFSQIQEAVDSLEKKLKALAFKDEDEKVAIRQQIVEIRQQIDTLNNRISNNVASLDETIDKQTASLREDLLSSREKLQEDIITLRNQLLDDLERRISTLTRGKLAKDDMAELLFELGLRLKGTEFVPQLKEAADIQESPNFMLTDQS